MLIKMTRMSTCSYNDFITEAGSPLSSADESFSDSETSSNAPDSLQGHQNQMGFAYLSEFFTGPPCSDTSGSTGTDSDGGSSRNLKSKSGRKPCKYVPHREKPVHVVEKRNARERRRVEAVNSAFVRLRRMVPHENRRKRISKVKTLRIAIDYIHYLQDMIEDYDTSQIQEMAGLQQVPGGGSGGGGVAGGVGGIVPHPAYLQQQGPPGWGCRTREDLLQGPQYHHQHQEQHQHQQLQHEFMSNSHTHLHSVHQYQPQQNQAYYQQVSYPLIMCSFI